MFESVFKTKKSKVILLVAVVVSILITVIGVKVYQDSIDKQWEPKTLEIALEYGDTRKINDKMFLTGRDDHVVVEKIDIDIPLVTDELNDESYYEIGDYRGVLYVSVNKTSLEFDFKVTIKDTTAPKLKVFNDRVVIYQGYSGDFKEFFIFEDLDDVIVSIERDDVNVYQVGEYKAKVVAIDASDNKTEKDFIVEVRPINTNTGNNGNTGEVIPEEPDKEEPNQPKEPVITTKDIKVEEEIDFDTIRIEDPELKEGEEVVKTEGKKGLIIIHYRVKYIDGVEQSRAEFYREIKRQKTDEVIHYGPKEPVEESGTKE